MKKRALLTLIFSAAAVSTLVLAVFLSAAGSRQQIFYSCSPFKEEEISSITFFQKDGSSLTTRDAGLISSAYNDLCILDTVTHQSVSPPPEGLYYPIVVKLQDGQTISIAAEYNFIAKKLLAFNQYYLFTNASDLYSLSQEYYALLENKGA